MSDDDVTILKEQVKTLFNTVGELKCDIKELKNALANRLPTWATLFIALLTAALGGCIGVIIAG
ncbi:MAG: hypothetical protein ACM3QW_10135 [Ignavibacteriales bacterium]